MDISIISNSPDETIEFGRKLGSQLKGGEVICFDEIHKMPKWKNILKDLYDSDNKMIRFIITGSARLDYFRKSGDSLAGRYFLFHLFPVTLQELCGKHTVIIEPAGSPLDWYTESRIDSTHRFSSYRRDY